MTDKIEISDSVEKRREMLIGASDEIWGLAETKYEEFRSARVLTEILEREGFRVTESVAGIKTAFVGEYGSGSPKIALLGEFDALRNMSQKAGCAERQPLQEDGNGHGCGHNGLGVGALAAAIAVKDWLEKHPGEGTICYYGCPAEETGAGKVFMMREGAFDGIDAALTWHPGVVNMPLNRGTLAMIQAYFKFRGISSHAGGSPELGRSALDAVELMDVGANYLREHVISDARIHYAITDPGGKSPNIVPAHAAVYYGIRAPKIAQAQEIFERLKKIAQGAALMTETECEMVFDNAISDFVVNNTLNLMIQKNLELFGVPSLTAEEQEEGRKFRETMTERDVDQSLHDLPAGFVRSVRNQAYADRIPPYVSHEGSYATFSADMGDISYVIPTAQLLGATEAIGTAEHSWQMVAQGKSGHFHKGMLLAGKVLAMTAIELIQSPEALEEAKSELREKTGDAEYVCPIPPDVQPEVER